MKKKPQILLVDDSKETLEGLNSYLGQSYRVYAAQNGLDALKIFEQHRSDLDLIITDIIMPDISGTALISMIKDSSPNTPIIAMTGWGQHPRDLASEAKADIVLGKPFELEDLAQSVSKLLFDRP